MIMKRIGLLALVSMLLALPSYGRTWRVEMDGSGDFMVIQDAVDAAADGDSIQIGPGLYSDYSFGYNNTMYDVYGCININKDMLTIIGTNPDETIVGFMEYPEETGLYINGLNSINGDHVILRDLSIQFLMAGAFWDGGDMDAERVAFRDCEFCVVALGGGRIFCSLAEDFIDKGVLLARGADGFEVIDTEFRSNTDGPAVAIAEAQDVLLRGLEITSGIGVSVALGGGATLENSYIVGTGNLAIGVEYAENLTLEGCAVQGAQQALVYDGVGSIVGSNCILVGGTWSTITTYGNNLTLHNCHIINGGGYSVRARMRANGLAEPLVLDLTNNFWGTADSEQIASWIEDYYDYDPNEGYHFVIVDYQPFMEDTVSVEKHSWTEVKEMFRD
jgi:hypothetical protein